ncbi:hypothetical protein [Rossellomorea marisflavi]
MTGIGLALVLVSTILYVHIITEKDRIRPIGGISDPIAASVLILLLGVYLIANDALGPYVGFTNGRLDIAFGAIGIGVLSPAIGLIAIGTITGTRLRHRRYGKPERQKRKNGGGTMTNEDKALQYAEKHGIVDYEMDANTMTYKESFPVEGNTYEVSVNLDTMKETRTELETESTRVTPLPLPENFKSDLYDYLKSENRIVCDYNTFRTFSRIYQTPHGIYIDKDMSEDERDHTINQLLNVDAEQLLGYKNAVDWLVRKDVHVHYIEDFDLYVRVMDTTRVMIAPKGHSA